MIQLPHNCKCSTLSVSPDNYKKNTADLKKPWLIHYRFYDAAGNVKQVKVRGMNRMTNWRDRLDDTNFLLKSELAKLMDGYNPITGQTTPDSKDLNTIPPRTWFFKALRSAMGRLTCSDITKNSIKSMLNILEPYALELKINNISIESVKRSHIKQILQLANARKKLSASNFNHYRAYLLMLFKELLELDAVETNPVSDIRKQLEVRKIRKTLTKEQEATIDAHLTEVHPAFRRYLHIFYHSGARSSEMVRLQGKDVHLEEGYFVKTILKGSQRKEVHAIIKTIALPYWQEAMHECKPDQYVFSRGLLPGNNQILYERITKLWNKHVKKELGINVDFYANKHAASDATAALLSLKHAKEHNSHSSDRTTLKYAQLHESREAQEVRELGNEFGS